MIRPISWADGPSNAVTTLQAILLDVYLHRIWL